MVLDCLCVLVRISCFLFFFLVQLNAGIKFRPKWCSLFFLAKWNDSLWPLRYHCQCCFTEDANLLFRVSGSYDNFLNCDIFLSFIFRNPAFLLSNTIRFLGRNDHSSWRMVRCFSNYPLCLYDRHCWKEIDLFYSPSFYAQRKSNIREND